MNQSSTQANLAQAIHLATQLHAGQVDKAGKDYIQHPLRVMDTVAGETEKIVAVLHDTLEDTSITFEELERQFGEIVANAVQTLSRLKQEDYFDFIERVKGNAIAAKVKIADLHDNMNLSRLNTVTQKDLDRVAKYQKALQMLQE